MKLNVSLQYLEECYFEHEIKIAVSCLIQKDFVKNMFNDFAILEESLDTQNKLLEMMYKEDKCMRDTSQTLQMNTHVYAILRNLQLNNVTLFRNFEESLEETNFVLTRQPEHYFEVFFKDIVEDHLYTTSILADAVYKRLIN